MRVVRISAEAAQELEEAAEWYEREIPRLGARLIDAFEHAIDLLRENLPPLTSLPGEAAHRGAKRLLLHLTFRGSGSGIFLIFQTGKPLFSLRNL